MSRQPPYFSAIIAQEEFANPSLSISTRLFLEAMIASGSQQTALNTLALRQRCLLKGLHRVG
jgi:hypothetical protein